MDQRTRPLILMFWCLILSLVLIPWSARAEVEHPFFQHRNGYVLSGPFLDFYKRHGGKARFGEPRTDAFVEPGGLTVQYFDYARFEWHDQVILSDLGRRAAARHANAEAFAWRDPAAPVAEGRVYVPESGHTLGGAFGWYWQTNGQVAMLGYPISEEFEEIQPDGTRRLTQYFERAILTYHPEQIGTADEVRRVPLGRQLAPERPTTPAPVVLAEARLPFAPGSGDAQNIALAMERLHGRTLAPGAKLSFLAATGPISGAGGYVSGSAIISGKIVGNTVGGGICAVSTLLYRVAWQAGLPVEERRGHSIWLQTFADRPGLDAAVAEPGLDLVIGNDTPGPLFLEARVAAGSATLRLWGAPDGRTVTIAGPIVRSNATTASAPGAPMPAPPLSQVGATVINTRSINLPGKGERTESVVTVYAPLPASDEPEEAEVTTEEAEATTEEAKVTTEEPGPLPARAETPW